MLIEDAIKIFQQAIYDYHESDSVDQEDRNSFEPGSLEHLLYIKCWIDTVQWHLEDVIRNPSIDPVEALNIKRKIDASNQRRTDLVEYIDSWFLSRYAEVKVSPDAGYNTESPAWAIDRLSILELKIYHMQIESTRPDASPEHRQVCENKLDILIAQRVDLSHAIQQLLDDIAAGRKFMKVYKQMKMYNDESLNPILYQNK